MATTSIIFDSGSACLWRRPQHPTVEDLERSGERITFRGEWLKVKSDGSQSAKFFYLTPRAVYYSSDAKSRDLQGELTLEGTFLSFSRQAEDLQDQYFSDEELEIEAEDAFFRNAADIINPEGNRKTEENLPDRNAPAGRIETTGNYLNTKASVGSKSKIQSSATHLTEETPDPQYLSTLLARRLKYRLQRLGQMKKNSRAFRDQKEPEMIVPDESEPSLNFRLRFWKGNRFTELSCFDRYTFLRWFKLLKKACLQVDFKKDFELLSELPSGPDCKVWVVRLRETREKFVAKIYSRRGLEQNPDLRKKVQNEVWAAKQFDHPGIIKLYFIYEEEISITLLYELIEGPPVGNIYRLGAKVNGRDFRCFMLSCIRGLQQFHANGFVHLNINPMTILLSKDPPLSKHTRSMLCGLTNVLKVRDFKGRFNPSDTVQVAYIAPEIIHYIERDESDHSKIDLFAADIFSLGSVFYCLMAKTDPLGFMTVEEDPVAKQKAYSKLQSNTRFLRFGKRVRNLVGEMTAADPKSRPSCSQLLENEIFRAKSLTAIKLNTSLPTNTRQTDYLATESSAQNFKGKEQIGSISIASDEEFVLVESDDEDDVIEAGAPAENHNHRVNTSVEAIKIVSTEIKEEEKELDRKPKSKKNSVILGTASKQRGSLYKSPSEAVIAETSDANRREGRKPLFVELLRDPESSKLASSPALN